MTIHVCTSKPCFEKILQPVSLVLVISGILKAFVPMCILNSPLFHKLHSFLLGGLFALNHQILCSVFSEINCFCQEIYGQCQTRVLYYETTNKILIYVRFKSSWAFFLATLYIFFFKPGGTDISNHKLQD